MGGQDSKAVLGREFSAEPKILASLRKQAGFFAFGEKMSIGDRFFATVKAQIKTATQSRCLICASRATRLEPDS
ncbi:MAG: hypothetical protein A2655_00945 [Candidatus Yanofskybacteria bacterium RIFCSPHIGHO2_01_FULL_43_42]|nr:MAG: hypothetical protein A2655_00945 [Candidatus Yanofskybacteria bacterium RIFCSPHIGHO2_01_FULL_43_42]